MRKIPCQRCNDIWLYCSDMDRFQWKMNCHFGKAWGVSEWKNTKEETIKYWNEAITLIDRNNLVELLKTPIHPLAGADPAEVVADYLIDNYKYFRKKAKWTMVDKSGNGVCSNCHRQDHIDELAVACRYCGCEIEF